MDNWGDPWADNADSTKSPTKDAVTSPLPTTFPTAPTILGGFLDDAGWGNEDEGFGDWSTATPGHVEQTPSPLTELNLTAPAAHSPVDAPWDAIDASDPDRKAVEEEGDWAGVRLDAHKDDDHVVSESSDASTTVQGEDTADSTTSLASAGPPKDDDSSARTSTSPSEASHNDIQLDSARTSYEEERGAVKVTTAEEHGSVVQSLVSDERVADTHEAQGQGEKGEDQVAEDTEPAAARNLADSAHSTISDLKGDPPALPAPPHSASAPSQSLDAPRSSAFAARAAFPIDSELLAKLFTLPKEEKQQNESPDDPIYSTEGRKAWYRLTRKQTMREFNNGNDDDNYIRVTWTNSHVRSEVNKIVGRWAREDRLSGTGPGARASFYWDTSAPIDPKPMANHMRQKSSMHIGNAPAPIQEQNLPSLGTDVPAAFSWSSAATATDPWQQSSSGIRSTSSPIAPMPPAVGQLQKHESRAVSLDLTPHKPEAAKHARNLTATNETPIVANLISPRISDANASAPQPWTGLDLFDNNATPKDVAAAPVAADDEDDWGEMVSSPTVSTPTLTRPASRVETRDTTLSTSATTPQSTRSVSLRDQSPDAMHATPIVRLKSTISPTSALFKPNPFVPMGIEQGPIGPGLLKSSKRAVSNPKRSEEIPPSKVEPIMKPAIEPEQPLSNESSDDLSAWETSVPEAEVVPPSPAPATVIVEETVRPATPPPTTTPPQQSDVDAWADADFSFFESSTVAPAPQSKLDPSDPFSMFETRERSTSSASSAKTFTRSPPRKVPTPPIQPLTGATSSAQRRKVEEDAIVQGILSGLPDLSYMLR